jgi:hypothetical protein
VVSASCEAPHAASRRASEESSDRFIFKLL